MKKATLRNAKVAFLWIEGCEQLHTFLKAHLFTVLALLQHAYWHHLQEVSL